MRRKPQRGEDSQAGPVPRKDWVAEQMDSGGCGRLLGKPEMLAFSPAGSSPSGIFG